MENDRYILVLISLKKKKGIIDKYRSNILNKKYPDNSHYQDRIIKELTERGLIRTVNSEGKLINGEWVRDYPDLEEYPETSDAGLQALRGGLFPSEYLGSMKRKTYKLIQLIGIIIAAIGGLITIITFLKSY